MHDVVIDGQPNATRQPDGSFVHTNGWQPFSDAVQHSPDHRIQTSPVSMPHNKNSVPSEPPPSYNEAVILQPSRLDMSETII